MSAENTKPKDFPDTREMMQRFDKDRAHTALMEILESNKNNPIKARIHNVYNMSVLGVMAKWESLETPDAALKAFVDQYEIYSRAEEGKALAEFVEGYKAYTLYRQQHDESDSSKLTEGSRK